MAVNHITEAECDKRHGRLWLGFKAGGAILAILATIVCGTFAVSWDAAIDASRANTAAEKNRMEMTTSFSFIREGIKRIEAEQAEQRKILTRWTGRRGEVPGGGE